MTIMIEPASRIQEKFHVLYPVNTENPAEAGAYGMYLFYRWQALGGVSSPDIMNPSLTPHSISLGRYRPLPQDNSGLMIF